MQEMCLTPEGMGKASLLCGSPYPTEGGSHIKTCFIWEIVQSSGLSPSTAHSCKKIHLLRISSNLRKMFLSE